MRGVKGDRPFVGEKWEIQQKSEKSSISFLGRPIFRSPIFTVGLELAGRTLSSEKNKEKEKEVKKTK